MSKKKLWFIGGISILLLVVGVSYAYWSLTFIQTENNVVMSDCFEIEFLEEDAIYLNKAYPMSDRDGLKNMPYTFMIQNVCSTLAFYQINLEEIETEVKALSDHYIKVSLNRSKGKLLDTYEEVLPTIEHAFSSHKLTSDSLKENEVKEFQLWLWMDENTPAINEVMNAAFFSKVSVITVYQEDVVNTIAVEYHSLNETFSKDQEIIEFVGRSDLYNIIEYSEDNVIWNPVDDPSQEVRIQKTYDLFGSYMMYFRDEMGNINQVEAVTNMIDDKGPILSINKDPSGWSNEAITIFITATDDQSGMHEDAYSFDGGITWGKNNFKSYTENVNDISIAVRDLLGNVSYLSTNITKIDKDAPIVKMKTTLHQNIISVMDDGSNDSQSSIVKREYKLDNGSYIVGGSNYQFQVGSGLHTVYLRVTDEAGNFSVVSAKITVANDVILYHLGTINYSYSLVSGGNQYPTLNADHIYFPSTYNKSLFFSSQFQNKFRYLKIIATVEKKTAMGNYYGAAFGVSKNTSCNSLGLPYDSIVIKREWAMLYSDQNKQNDYFNYTTFTLDLNDVRENYFVFLHNCDSIFKVQKVWLTNNN